MKVSEWVEKFESGIPKDYPVIMCGWPDSEHGITHDAYIASCISELEDVYDGEDAPLLGSYKEWVERQREAHRVSDDLGFSWQDCEICGALAGDRYAVTAFPSPIGDGTDYIPLEVCDCCLLYIANGDLPCDLEDD